MSDTRPKYLIESDVRTRYGGVSRMWVVRAIQQRGFPKPRKLGGNKKSRSFFPVAELDDWDEKNLVRPLGGDDHE